MSRLCKLLALVTVFCGLIGGARAEDVNCVVTLFKTAIHDNISKEDDVFFLDQVDQSNYEQVKNDLNVVVPEYFYGTWNQFKEKRDTYKRNLQLTTDQKYSRQYAISTLTPEGVTAYTNCLRALRGQTQLSLYPAKAQFNDQDVTFVIDLKSPAQLAGPARIEVFGAKRLVSAPAPTDKVSVSQGVIHIEVLNLRDFRTFTVERQGPRAPLRITAEDSGLVADPPIEVGPVVKAVTKLVDVPLTPVEDTIHYLARRLEPGTDRIDWRWAYNKLQSSGDATGQVFVGNMCICTSGQRETSGDFHGAGRCVPRTNTEERLLPDTIRLSTPGVNMAQRYSCGSPAQEQVPVELVDTGADGDAYCYAFRQSLNVPPSGSSECQTYFSLTGMKRVKQVVFEGQ